MLQDKSKIVSLSHEHLMVKLIVVKTSTKEMEKLNIKHIFLQSETVLQATDREEGIKERG